MHDAVVHFELEPLSQHSRYQLYLPAKEQLRREPARAIEEESRHAKPPRKERKGKAAK